MMRYLIALAFCLLTTPAFSYDDEAKEEFFASTPEQLATLSSEPSYLIGGLVSPLSGHPALRVTDLVVKGAQNIILNRTYIPPYMPCFFEKYRNNQKEGNKYHLYYHLAHNYKGWQFYPHLKLQFTPSSREVLLTDPSGMSLQFSLSGPNYSVATLVSLPYGLSNAAGDIPSGKYDPRNTRISYEENGEKITVYATDGTVRFYYKKDKRNSPTLLYFLDKEIFPNGKVLKYQYGANEHLSYIESLDPKERLVYASIRITGSPIEGNCHFTSSSGLSADYDYQKRRIQVKIKEEIKHWYGNEKHKEERNFICPPILTHVSAPSYRSESLSYSEQFLLDSYFGKNDVFNSQHASFGEIVQHYRVHKLLLPVGKNDAFESVYELAYQPPVAGEKEGRTTVKNSDGTSLIYHFSKNLLTTSIQYFGQDKDLKKEKIFSWDDNNWLASIEMRDGQKKLLYKKAYEYDKFGNPALETFTGDLTGEGEQETFTTKRTFSEDGRHLLLREETEDGKVVCFSYLSGTNLNTSKLTKESDKTILREFSVYDDCNNLIQTISDDGEGEDKDNLSGVTQRLLTTYTLRQSAPFLHMPEWIEETYLENGAEKPLKKSHLTYDQHGNVAEEEVYDAKEILAYTIYKTYNERGDVLTETNPLGQEATYTYDARGRLQTATNFSNRLHKTFTHDTRGRFVKLEEKGDDGVVHVIAAKYDWHDRKTRKTDPFSNSVHYTYDPLVGEITKTEFPSIASLDGRDIPVTTFSSYDPFGRELTKTDANGNVTAYRYNVYGSQTEILQPNGGKEIFRYAKNGDLISHTDPDGLMVHYKNDVLGRVLSKTYISADGVTIAEETFTYNGFNLLTKTDKEGNLKQYVYDGSGRKIREEFCRQVTDFSYDSLGWLATIRNHNGSNTLLLHYERDVEGRLLEERKTDTSGYLLYKIRYSYDEDGNKKTVTRTINGKEAVDSFVYDSFTRCIQYTDAMGYLSKTVYNENYINPLNQKVLQRVSIDPRQITTIETLDVLARTVRTEALNSRGMTISGREMIYDPQGNLTYQKDHVYENDRFRNTQIVKYSYTSNHQIEALTRRFGTKDTRITSYTYLPSGKRATKTLPDGVALLYDYHPLGFMSRLDSSDGRIHHAFEYDKLGYLKSATDENQNITIKREVDPFGNVTRETLPYGLEVAKKYDDLSRLTSLKMGSQGEILYSYDPLFLRAVTRISGQGKTLYSHTYDNYDEDGNLVSESLIGNLGHVMHLTEPSRQKSSISSPYFSQECKYDSVGNLKMSIVDKEAHHYSYDGMSQLSSESGLDQSTLYAHDSLYNRIQKDGKEHVVNDLNELLSLDGILCSYDLNGNQILNKTASETSILTYDPLGQLIEVVSERQKVRFSYDPLGRRLSKVLCTATLDGQQDAYREYYLYDGQNEIGAFTTSNEPKNLRVLGRAAYTVAVEVQDHIFAPIIDVQGNIRRLVDLETKSIAASYDFTAFGEELRDPIKDSTFNPWCFASKRQDRELDLIYFGKRYYNPHIGRWLTTDPAGFVDSFNPYQYVLNNPFRYTDPDGRFAIPLLIWGAELALPAISAYVVPAICAALTGAVVYNAVQSLNEKDDGYSPADDYANYVMQCEVAEEEERKKKENTNPFDGPVGGDVFVGDAQGNIIPVPEGQWLTGSEDGKWLQVREPSDNPRGKPTGVRKDGGHPKGPKHPDPRGWEPHGHVPGVFNLDGTPWLPIY